MNRRTFIAAAAGLVLTPSLSPAKSGAVLVITRAECEQWQDNYSLLFKLIRNKDFAPVGTVIRQLRSKLDVPDGESTTKYLCKYIVERGWTGATITWDGKHAGLFFNF